MGGPAMNGPVEKAKDFKGTMRTLMSYLAKYKLSIIIVFIFAIGSVTFSVIGPKILGKATTEIFNGLVGKVSGEGSGIDFEAIKRILIVLVILYIVSAIFSFVQGYVMSGISQKVAYNLRDELVKKINRLPMKYFDTRTHGEVLSRFTNDIDTLAMSLNQSLTQIITSVTTLVGVLIMMLTISVLMTVSALVVIPISLFIISFVIKKSQKYFKSQQEYLGNVNGQVEELYGGHTVVQAFNGEEESIKEFNKINNKLYDSAWRAQFLSSIMQPIMMFVGNLSYVVVSILGGYLVIKNRIEVGDIQSFIQYVRSFNQPIAQMAQISNQLQSTAAAAERVFEFLNEEEEDVTVENPVSIEGLEGRIDFENVKFGYDKNRTIIKDFTAHVKPGQKVALVGPTGAGKSTMIKLLMRFYDVNSGAILVDGHNVKDFNRGELRELFGMVLQDTWLFSGSIKENIRYGRLNASDDEVINAAKAAHVHHFIKTLPDGYNMLLNEESSNISQGQKQLLTIARAILADPKILILDEATSSVDTRTELLIQKAMDNLMEGRTSFVIAHRLSTIRNADLILVINDGDIVEQGNHEELLAKDGFYANLYNSQFENKEAM
ncbi:MAG: ABC transporter ATP-binding protein [Terrisporobacter othiniensis]|uniref:ABC transporter ATP-binding protein/permease n=2 Tax=Peptostreptococcaceae TaxID=186804 RepID=A0AAX2ZKE5_9FIRM|nr:MULTISPECIES: ABC transporter ATP-binding protein [Terrisporobacter]MDU4861419.1 ABC transporter ATP-binding protein [Terrisporobacter othiniensis]MDU6994632.1 ABC transporter ATP-binding protein [Terrisporobacter othiniensis]UEL49788.1 ABC transporter ATP-binding protein/permease [Terrisporobacter hibernicus]